MLGGRCRRYWRSGTSDTHAEDQSRVGIDEGITIKSIDVEELLAKRFKIDTSTGRHAEDSGCPGHSSGPGFQAKEACDHYTQFRDLKIDRISEIKIGSIDVSKLPVSRKDGRKEFENRWADPYLFKESVTYRSQQSATVVFSEVLTKVADYTGSLDVNRSDMIGSADAHQCFKSLTSATSGDARICCSLEITTHT